MTISLYALWNYFNAIKVLLYRQQVGKAIQSPCALSYCNAIKVRLYRKQVGTAIQPLCALSYFNVIKVRLYRQQDGGRAIQSSNYQNILCCHIFIFAEDKEYKLDGLRCPDLDLNRPSDGDGVSWSGEVV